MRKLILLASAAAMAAVMPAEAKPGRGGGKSAVKADTIAKAKGNAVRTRTDARTGGRARTDARADVRARTRTGANVDRAASRTTDADADGIPDYRDRDVDIRNTRWVLQNGQWVRVSEVGRTTHPQGCPPGLANRTPACVPPGQAKRMWQQGQAVPTSWRDYVTYQDLMGRVPTGWNGNIPTGDYRYIYRDNTVYVVDPRTRMIDRIIDIVR